MVIFIIPFSKDGGITITQFTFQYGYIYYGSYEKNQKILKTIYIPIWLYLLLW